jgi:APA family basic amino acid/polyamine antiporter
MLNRELTFNDLLYIGIGNIIGGGIFSLMGRSIKFGGGLTWLYLIATGLLMYFISKGYTDIMDQLRDSESEFKIAEGFAGSKFASGYILSSVLASASSGAVISLAFTEHLKEIFNINYSDATVSILVILAITAINLMGIRESTAIINTMTIVELIALVLLSLMLPWNYNSTELAKSPPNLMKSALVPLIIIFAYTGAEALPKLAGESKNPQQDIPKAINWSILTTSILYAVICMVMISVLGVEGASSSKTPILDVFKNVFGNKISGVVTIIALIAILNGVIMSNVSGSRSLYGFAKKIGISGLNYVNDKTKTPMISIIVTSLLSIGLLMLSGSIEYLAIFANMFVMITMIIINGAALKTSKTNAQSARNFISMLLASVFIFFASKELYGEVS